MKSNPVMMAGGIASAVVLLVGAFLAMAVSLGWLSLTPEQIESVNGFAVALVAMVVITVPLVTAWFANRKVQETMTPLADPRTPDGEELTRADGSPALKARE